MFFYIARVKRVCKNGFKNSTKHNTSYIVCANHNKNILLSRAAIIRTAVYIIRSRRVIRTYNYNYCPRAYREDNFFILFYFIFAENARQTSHVQLSHRTTVSVTGGRRGGVHCIKGRRIIIIYMYATCKSRPWGGVICILQKRRGGKIIFPDANRVRVVLLTCSTGVREKRLRHRTSPLQPWRDPPS